MGLVGISAVKLSKEVVTLVRPCEQDKSLFYLEGRFWISFHDYAELVAKGLMFLQTEIKEDYK